MVNNKEQFKTVLKFQDLGDFRRQVLQLDRAEKKDVYVNEATGPTSRPTASANSGAFVLAKKYQAVWNTDRNQLACIASKKYAIIQHREAFSEVAEAIGELGLGVFGQILNYGNKAVAQVIFKDHNIKDDSATGVNLGISLVNSYDSTRSLRGELFGFRSICSNGMVLGKTLIAEFKQVHAGHAFNTVREQIARFIREAIESSTRLQKLVSEAIAQTLEWQLCEELVKKTFEVEKWRKIVLRQLQEEYASKGKKLTRYDVYNVITSLASHGRNGITLKEGAEKYLQQKAQVVLATPLIGGDTE